MTITELLDAEELPCKVCSAPVPITRRMRVELLQRHIKDMQKIGKRSISYDGWRIHYLEDDLAELRTLPGITCRGAHVPQQATCQSCGERFQAHRNTARFCSTKCRVAAHRKRQI